MALDAYGGTVQPTTMDRRATNTVARTRSGIAPEMPEYPRWSDFDMDAAALFGSPMQQQNMMLPQNFMQRLGLADITKTSFAPQDEYQAPDLSALFGGDSQAGAALASSGSTKGMNPGFAAALAKANAAMRAAGLGNFSITSGFRSYDQQAALYDKYKRGEGNLAAPPGRSLHEKGRAVDLNWSQLNSKQRAWLRANLPKFGVTPIKSEAWHWEWRS